MCASLVHSVHNKTEVHVAQVRLHLPTAENLNSGSSHLHVRNAGRTTCATIPHPNTALHCLSSGDLGQSAWKGSLQGIFYFSLSVYFLENFTYIIFRQIFKFICIPLPSILFFIFYFYLPEFFMFSVSVHSFSFLVGTLSPSLSGRKEFSSAEQHRRPFEVHPFSVVDLLDHCVSLLC